MNAPDRDELYHLEHGDERIKIARDTRLPNAITARIFKEDHTVGNLLRYQLLKDPRVLFAGYKVPHPLQYEVHVKLQTTGPTGAAAAGVPLDGAAGGLVAGTPEEVLVDSIDHIIGQLKDVQDAFEAAFSARASVA